MALFCNVFFQRTFQIFTYQMKFKEMILGSTTYGGLYVFKLTILASVALLHLSVQVDTRISVVENKIRAHVFSFSIERPLAIAHCKLKLGSIHAKFPRPRSGRYVEKKLVHLNVITKINQTYKVQR